MKNLELYLALLRRKIEEEMDIQVELPANYEQIMDHGLDRLADEGDKFATSEITQEMLAQM